jgi:chromosome segregation ATPase
VQEQTFSQQIALTDIDLPTILAYQTQGKASKAVVDAFREGQKKRAEIAELQRQIEAIDRERAEIDKDQARVRENMRTIERDTDLYRSYIKQFTDQETRLKELSTQAKSVREQIEARRQAFSQWVTNLNVE